MYEQGWSWVRALESGALSAVQRESLQAMVDNGEAETMAQAALMLDHDLANREERDSEPDE
jgi:hypothetical protein